MNGTKIVVTVSGGNVNGIYTSDPNVEVYLVDYDNLREEPNQDCDIPISPDPVGIYRSVMEEEIKLYPGLAKLFAKLKK